MRTYVSLIVFATFQGNLFAGGRIGLIDQWRTPASNGQGSSQAASGWKELSQQGPDSIIALLTALDGANPIAANWIRSALDTVVERAKAAQKPLPTIELE